MHLRCGFLLSLSGERFKVGAPAIQRREAFRKSARSRQPARRIPVGRIGDVLPDQRILDIRLPSRRERLAEVPGRELIQQNAERVDVGGG